MSLTPWQDPKGKLEALEVVFGAGRVPPTLHYYLGPDITGTQMLALAEHVLVELYREAERPGIERINYPYSNSLAIKDRRVMLVPYASRVRAEIQFGGNKFPLVLAATAYGETPTRFIDFTALDIFGQS